jgi:molybdopterin/thiamine biosynthesis adenylyltransferase
MGDTAMSEAVHLGRLDEADGRFDRQARISWWDQEVLRSAKVLVVGAGALGNEIVKNLALVGIGRLFVCDMDRIESSNLSRSVLFRDSDIGRAKARVAADRAAEIYPAIKVQPFCGNAVYDLGLGVYRWADIVIGGLDNREARLSINRNCWRMGRPWIDGAIEELRGVARVFVPPEGACYECTMNDVDWEMLNRRRSCALLSRDEMQNGRVPTTATISSIIAGIQCQEAIKYLHKRATLNGQGIVFDGLHHDVYVVEYPRKEECYSHETYPAVNELGFGTTDRSLRFLLEVIRGRMGGEAVIELREDLLSHLECPQCHDREDVFTSLGRVTEQQALCPRCGVARIPQTFHTVYGTESFMDRTPAAIGIPPFDVVIGRVESREQPFLFDADARATLGPCAEEPT